VSESRKWELMTAPQPYLQTADGLLRHINVHRYEADTKKSTQQRELTFYTDLIAVIVKWFTETVSEDSTGSVWKLIVSLHEARSRICHSIKIDISHAHANARRHIYIYIYIYIYIIYLLFINRLSRARRCWV